MENYTKQEVLGKGAFGVVYRAKDMRTQKEVAIKKIRYRNEEEGVPAHVVREVSIMRELEHPNILRLLDVLLEKDRVYLVLDCLAMDLGDLINKIPRGKFLDRDVVKSYLYQVNVAVLFCHKRGILHRDLKPQNILIDSTATIKLGDFGIARRIDVPVKVYTHEVVTLWYRAPEVLLGSNRYSCPVDMWSIGCIFAEMVNKIPIFRGDSEISQLFRIFSVLKTPREDIWPGVTQLRDFNQNFPNWTENVLASQVPSLDGDGLDLLQKMLIYNPSQRMSAKDAVNHPYFHDLDKSKVPALP